MLPNGWSELTLGAISKFLSGGTPSKQNSEFWDGDLPWISGKDLKEHYLSSSIDYQDGYEIHLTCFTCTSKEKPTKLSVHSEYVWTTPDHIYDYNFFKSDKMLVEALKGVWPCLTKPMKPKY